MYDQNLILIQKVSNGWIVTLPIIRRIISNEESFRLQAKIMKEEFVASKIKK